MEPLEDLVAANRILAAHGVIDAYGHVSLRSARGYTLARAIAPERVQLEDLGEYDLDSNPLDARGREPVRAQTSVIVPCCPKRASSMNQTRTFPPYGAIASRTASTKRGLGS